MKSKLCIYSLLCIVIEKIDLINIYVYKKIIMDNPFEEDNSVNQLSALDSEYNILLWKERRGRKTNTYVTGWNISESELKQYLKDFKKANGCNGSIKLEDGNLMLQLQGDKIDEITKFMLLKGIKEDNIRLKGQ